MLRSKCLSSRRGPLWVAAYCFKGLKKAQVFETDISSSVDKILKDEMDAVSYRVLAYLLLGVVRIYSKKVEYLLHDCNEVLVGIKKFVIDTKDNARMETLRMSITIPDRFELDAFDLDILEDAAGCHVAPQEEITLKDVLCKTEGFGQSSLDKYQFEEFDFSQNTCSADHLMAEDVCQSHLMDMAFEIFPPNSPFNFQAGKDKFQNSISCQEEQMNFDSAFVVEGVHTEPVNLFSQDQQINEEQKVHETAPYEDEIHDERSRISQEESEDISIFSNREEEPVFSIKQFNESHQVDEEQVMAKETSSTLCQMHQKIREVHEARSLPESMERPQDDTSYPKECMDQCKSSVAMEKLEERIKGSVEHDNEGKLEFQEKVSLEDGNVNVIPRESKNLDVTPQSRFQGGSAARPKRGATTPEFMLVSTPAVRERAHFSRKRKCVLDELVVLPNEVLRQSIHDASDLISNRRKFRRTLHAVQRQSRISSLPEGFYESFLSRTSLELRFLFSKEKMKIPNSLEIVETPGKLDYPESQTVGRIEHKATAPQTPPQCSKIKVRSIEHPESAEIQNSDNLGLSSPPESMEREQSLERDEELNLMEEFNVGTSRSHESLETEQYLTKDEDLNLMNEEINSSETENSDLSGWSERTRKVARYLHKSFLDLREHREEEVVNFSQVLGGRGRKECARLFYEILVLRTTSYVDVKQNNAYGDLSVRKLPKLDLTFVIDGP